jgi:hypothetical protein
MKTLANHLEDQLTANIVRSEINNGRTVYLVLINGTDRTALTSQPIVFGGEKVKGGKGFISMEGTSTGADTYSTPIDQVSDLVNVPEFDMIEA